jgi:hypothetical protein
VQGWHLEAVEESHVDAAHPFPLGLLPTKHQRLRTQDLPEPTRVARVIIQVLAFELGAASVLLAGEEGLQEMVQPSKGLEAGRAKGWGNLLALLAAVWSTVWLPAHWDTGGQCAEAHQQVGEA